uniref:Uncharacterized protein n=1 Tax=Meloidogyne enterolobii TaxID=390850 RepID=A0A6V7WHH4_MELEN|nr:unnamed protein product [Meloidogyne enterolobii]
MLQYLSLFGWTTLILVERICRVVIGDWEIFIIFGSRPNCLGNFIFCFLRSLGMSFLNFT